ncbi:MAG TPA: glycoside hydrolase family 2 TIM barrel-domain containing protein [Bacteroidales bacterium]|nr:glycoside hydrolase family 2 TIM barrel-domain containing protein [Bacteroidales bacterium]HOX75832.1 glycoside hydrolase family 2 TIM barrel-domain containing protein [Bacteroidales bacterium]HPM88803.1 glycoside hydrolase family 2 TIM barrel-domain containing protein [Bacteroidales bacterium]HQM68591.1 glycoside hydrolase family 2 TIM barrel-domain containing protein [Bacteroidales bacterium]
MKKTITCILFIFAVSLSRGQLPGTDIDLNGIWEFEQTDEAFPPERFSRKCPVPGLIHLAQPEIEAYDQLFQKPSESYYEETSDYTNIKYKPKYSWYRRIIDIPSLQEGTEVMLTILKSQFVTQVYINGHDAGQSVACYTPVRLKITDAIRPGEPNEILIRVGERIWLPPWAAGSTDKEKANYIPGIWDDVYLSFSGKQKILNSLILPSVKESKVTVKILVRSFYPQQVMYGDPMQDSIMINVVLKEKLSGNVLAKSLLRGSAVRDNESLFELEIPVTSFKTWSPEHPFLYKAEIILSDRSDYSDRITEVFGMRDFERRGKYFYLNGEKYIFRGTNITLHRFFEDPDCRELPWDREWVKRMLIDDPKKIGWNAMRICVGLVPDFWYDLADEYGIMFQNEWMYWQNHGWDQQIREEYTDWVWSDGNHPSIVIWDAINENWNSFIGNILIPELQKLDPTRIWDAGYMVASDMLTEDPVDEPHPYRAAWGFNNAKDPAEYIMKNPYLLGKIDDWEEGHRRFLTATAAQLVNEYGWNWLWRDGQAAKLTKKAYDHLIGENATPEQRREFQAYWLQCETEWLRAERSFAGVLAFTHLTNNYGFTGDWYINDIRDLEAGPSFQWFRHAFAPANVFIDLADQRYFPNGNYSPGQKLDFKLVGVNDHPEPVTGRIELLLLDSGNKIIKRIRSEISIPPYGRTDQPASLRLPSRNGGYLIVTEFQPSGGQQIFRSRRYIRIGDSEQYSFPAVKP